MIAVNFPIKPRSRAVPRGLDDLPKPLREVSGLRYVFLPGGRTSINMAVLERGRGPRGVFAAAFETTEHNRLSVLVPSLTLILTSFVG